MTTNQQAQVLDLLQAIRDTTDDGERKQHIANLKSTLTEWQEVASDTWKSAVDKAVQEEGEEALKPLEAWLQGEKDRIGGPVATRTAWTAEPEDRQWLVEGWLPAGRVALLSGQGGAGKSRLALQLAAAVVENQQDWLHGGPFLKHGGPAVIATWEDEPDEISRRLRGMMGDARKLEALAARLHVLDFAGKGSLWQPMQGGSRHTSTLGELAPAGQWTRAYCEKHQARLLVIDPLAAAYACNENDRGLVRAFMASWDGWARANGCAVLILAHPPKGEADYSGSTDWHAAARAVWTLGTVETGTGNGEGKAKEKAPAPRLECLKTSYGVPQHRHYWLEGWPAWRVQNANEASRQWVEKQGKQTAYTQSDGARTAGKPDGKAAGNEAQRLGL